MLTRAQTVTPLTHTLLFQTHTRQPRQDTVASTAKCFAQSQITPAVDPFPPLFFLVYSQPEVDVALADQPAVPQLVDRKHIMTMPR